MKRFFQIIRLFYNLYRVAKNPKNTASALAISESFEKLGLISEQIRYLKTDPQSKEKIETRFSLKPISLSELQAMPEGSLGKAYFDHMTQLQLEPDFFKSLEIDSEEKYSMMHARKTHDIWHVLTGFGTSAADELGLQAVNAAQAHSPLAPLLIAGRMLAVSFQNPEQAETRKILSRVSTGWKMGIEAKFIFGINFDEHWETPLVELQRMYRISPTTPVHE